MAADTWSLASVPVKADLNLRGKALRDGVPNAEADVGCQVGSRIEHLLGIDARVR